MRNRIETAGSAKRKLCYSTHVGFVRCDEKIRCGFTIQVREIGSRKPHAVVSVGEKPLLYFDEATAKRHCAWLNDPKGTEPEWGKDESPNAHRDRPADGGER